MSDPSVTAAEPLPLKTVEDISGGLEALLLIAEEPLPLADLAAALDATTAVVAEALAELVAFYDQSGRGFELREVGGGWRYYTRAEHHELVSGYLLEGQQAKLSQAALETLAVVAYQQPIARGRISAIRGVSVDGVMRTLLQRGLIAEAGHDPESGAMLFRTTGYFLERMGLRGLDELPALAPHLPDAAELEAELSQLARPEPVPELSDATVAPATTESDNSEEEETNDE